jgi:hypothetical protein
MAASRWWLLTGLLGASLCAGCDLASLAYFVLPEPKENAELKRLASDDKKKEVKVVILTYSALDPRRDTLQADRQLTELLARQLNELCQQNEEKVSIVPPRKVEEFKNLHPSRRGYDPAVVGKEFKADYVVYLELNQLSLYENGTGDMLARGRIHLTVSLIDVHHPDEEQDPREFVCTYPSDSTGPKEICPEMPLSLFRQQFLSYVAKRLSWYFAPHPKHDRVTQMD